MASGKQYYKYKAKAQALDDLLYDLRTLLLIDESDDKEKIRKLALLTGKYEFVAGRKYETL